ncbi:MAG: DEAD/DEAH box helicase [Candidatus Micrarchaeota archaeon]|nr:DEAD/DEAH box helicase [Candidatus Micrarchaeota archaeon]
MKNFSEMNLDPALVEALRRVNFITATEVQDHVIPVAIHGTDVIVRAKTGTGKTAAFLIPIIQSKPMGSGTEAIIIVPTRELALQIHEFASKLLPRRDGIAVVYGGASINVQMSALRHRPRIVVGTPGRIIDLIERGALHLEGIRFLVLDEADTMLDMGFIEDVEFIMSKTPHNKQTLLFSATMPERIRNVARSHMKSPSFISVGAEEEMVVTKIKHYFASCDNFMKFATLLAYIKQNNPKKAIVFVQTQYAADAIHQALREQGIHAILMHGGLTQAKREHSLREFKKGASLLIATNVAARGIDISGISDVINFDCPEDPHVYVHRVGRSARMNADGRAFTIVSNNERGLIRDIEDVTNIKMEQMRLDISKYAHIRAFKRQGAGGGGGGRGRDGFRGRDRGGGGFRGGGYRGSSDRRDYGGHPGRKRWDHGNR